MVKILVVDAEESVGYSFSKLLRAPEYEVHGAKAGNEGQRKLTEGAPDLVGDS